jgi:hypothetical protein
MRIRLPVLSVGALVLLCLSPPFARSQTKPVVVSTNPPNGATGLSPFLSSFSITFSKPMDTSMCGASTRSWPYPPSGQGGSCTWSADKLTMTLTRYNPETPFPPGLKIEVYLNDSEMAPLKDSEGNKLDLYYFSFTIAESPKVVSTNPPDGATNVPASLEAVTITFSKPMDTSVCGAATNWPYQNGGSCTWSADKLTMMLKRYNAVISQRYVVYVNLPDTGPFLKDADGLYVNSYGFAFTIKAASSTTLKISADPQKGFQWPYYLYVPGAPKSPAVLLVEPNNSGHPTDDPSEDDRLASDLFNNYKYRGEDLGSPYLVPTFPRPAAHPEIYTQSLDRPTLTTTVPGLVRIDLQLIAMIDDARARLAAMGMNVGPKIWMIGYSASGSFANRFALLHPDRIQAMSAGSGNEYATAPVSVWKGKTLPFPVGIADLAQLVGSPFDTAAFSKVPVQIYIGDRQFSDAVDGYDPAYTTLIKEVFGGPTFRRYPASEAAYNSIGSNCQFVIFPGVGHVWPDWGFIREFLERNRTEPYPPAPPKPFLYTLYFPHVASFGQWETEVALTNTSEVPVRGELRAMTADGGDPIESIPITIPAEGRVEITVGKSFHRPLDIAYLALLSDSGFLAGYTRFYQPGNRASLALGSGGNHGWFTKMEKDGWTGIAFVNVGTVTATVTLTAYDDNGNQVASTTLPVAPGKKFVGMVDQLFKSDLSNATYCRYSSDRNLLGFTVSGSSDGQMLDGLHALSDYISAKK